MSTAPTRINAGRIAARLVEAVRIQWLRQRAQAADDEIRAAHKLGIVGTETLRQYALQRDAFMAEIAALETRRLIERLDVRSARLPRG